ncbi:uncharacterized protein LOC110986938 [Acanthaster planci]|uniref:Uncharacterized protein LOC110986938 n=1 Tax=Acanthaster planci TaxID=133434 RepID=A0A8B7ZIY9_ACAPL|nr:uncharacterized protein LOC110986938 [Acanthaster planci]
MTCHKLLATAGLLLIFAVWTSQAINYYKQNKDTGSYSPPSSSRSRLPAKSQTGPSNALWIRTRDAPLDTLRYRVPMDRRMVPASMLFVDGNPDNMDKRLFEGLFPSNDRLNRYRRIAALLESEDDF